jgi:RimJ/RimL family protein N-acetyltransferase
MARNDLQIGATWTAEAWRRRGLASAALDFAVRANDRAGRTFWYLTEAANAASVKVVERCGFVRQSRGRRTSPLGLRLLGAYIPD